MSREIKEREKRECMEIHMGFHGGSVVKNPLAMQETMFDPWVGKVPWRRKWLPTPAFLPGKSHRQRSLAGYRPWDCKELDTTEQLRAHYSGQPLTMAVPCQSFLHCFIYDAYL